MLQNRFWRLRASSKDVLGSSTTVETQSQQLSKEEKAHLGRVEPWVSCKSPGAYISNQTQEWAWTCRQCEFLSQQLREGRRPLPEPPQKMLQTLIPVKEAGDSEKDSICILIKICLRVSLAVRTVSIPIGFYVVRITRNWQGAPLWQDHLGKLIKHGTKSRE